MPKAILIYIGGCGGSWPYNTTPIQRAKSICGSFDEVYFVDAEETLSEFLQPYGEYLKCSDNAALKSAVEKIAESNSELYILTGPNWRSAKAILSLRNKISFKWIIDLYDHERLTSLLHWRRKRYLKWLFHYYLEKNLIKGIWSADMLISAIAENRYINHGFRVKSINGVDAERIKEISCSKSASPAVERTEYQERRTLRIGYIGVLSWERSALIYSIIDAFKGNAILDLCDLEFHLFGEFEEGFKEKVLSSDVKSLRTVFYGFSKWADVIERFRDIDVGMYTFPVKDRPELNCVYPIKLGEYLALGKKVISVKSDGVEEMLTDKLLDVTLVEEADISGWVTAIENNMIALSGSNQMRLISPKNEGFAFNYLSWDKTSISVVKGIADV